MANGNKNKRQFDLGFDRETYSSPSDTTAGLNIIDQPSLSDDTTDLPKTNTLNFDFSRPMDRISLGSIDLEPEETPWYPFKGVFEGLQQGLRGLQAGYNYLGTITNPESKYDQLKALKGFEKILKKAPPPSDDPVTSAGQFIGKLIPSAVPIVVGIVASRFGFKKTSD